MKIERLGASILDGLLPQHCALCGLPSGRAWPLCPPCEGEMPANTSCCERCAIPLSAIDGHRVCGRCQHRVPPFARVLAPWRYEEQLAHLIGRWKYGGDRRLTPLLAGLWWQRARPDSVQLLVPVPLHWRRHWRRGFNQAALLCDSLAKHGDLPGGPRVAHRLVRRVRATSPQQGMGLRARMANMTSAFTVSEPCDNLRLAIVDDVLTTGATATAMTRALRAAGACHVEVWCLARTPSPGG